MNKSPTNVVWIRARNLSRRNFRIVATWLVFFWGPMGMERATNSRGHPNSANDSFMRVYEIVYDSCSWERQSERVLLKVAVCYTSSHLHYPRMFTYSHHLIFTFSHLHIFLPSHTHIFTSSHVLIFTSSHHHIRTSSHIFCFSLSLSLSRSSPSHLDIFLLLTFTYSHLQIFTSSIIFSSSHLHIFSLSLSLSCPLSRSLSFFFFSLLRPQAVPTRRHNMATLSHEVRVSITEVFLQFNIVGGNPFARNGVRVSKADSFFDFGWSGGNPFARNGVWVSKT